MTYKVKRISAQIHHINDVSYKDVWDFQSLLQQDIIRVKRNCNLADIERAAHLNHIIFCEHLPVFTFGKSAKDAHMTADPDSLSKSGYEVHHINRGGDITFHGPGQLTTYLIFDLELLYRDVHRYVRNLELAVIMTLAEFGIGGCRIEGYSGVWIRDGKKYRKICALGVHLSRWVSMHGIGFNINTDLKHFKKIIPCGISDHDKSVTSMAQELGEALDMLQVKEILKSKLASIFSLTTYDPYD